MNCEVNNTLQTTGSANTFQGRSRTQAEYQNDALENSRFNRAGSLTRPGLRNHPTTTKHRSKGSLPGPRAEEFAPMKILVTKGQKEMAQACSSGTSGIKLKCKKKIGNQDKDGERTTADQNQRHHNGFRTIPKES